MLNLKLIEKVILSEVKLLAKWRRKVQSLWHETFKVTTKGTADWLQKVIDNPDKHLYFVKKDGVPIGHVGFNVIDGDFHIDNIIRGEGKSDGSMTKAVKKLINYNYIKTAYTLVFPDNKNAIKFYEKIGFIPHRMKGKYLQMKYENSN